MAWPDGLHMCELFVLAVSVSFYIHRLWLWGIDKEPTAHAVGSVCVIICQRVGYAAILSLLGRWCCNLWGGVSD